MEITIDRKLAEIMLTYVKLNYRLALATQADLAQKLNAEKDYSIVELFIDRANEVSAAIEAWVQTGRWLLLLKRYFSVETAAVSVNCPDTAAPYLLKAYNKAQQYR